MSKTSDSVEQDVHIEIPVRISALISKYDILFSEVNLSRSFIKGAIDNESREFNVAAELKSLENNENKYFRAYEIIIIWCKKLNLSMPRAFS